MSIIPKRPMTKVYFHPVHLSHKQQHYDNGVSALRWRELITEERQPQEKEGTRQMLLYRHDADPGPQQSAPLGLTQVTSDSPNASRVTLQQTLIQLKISGHMQNAL